MVYGYTVPSHLLSTAYPTPIQLLSDVKNRLTGWPRWNMGLSAEDIAEVRVQGIEPDLF
jgi:hypothetical protein